MVEIELKFQVPAGHGAAVARDVAGRQPVSVLRLQAAYFDTADGALAAAGLALRLRREGRRWVQTLKGAGQDGLSRLEHNVACGQAAAAPTLDPLRHAGTEVGARLLALLEALPAAQLVCQCRTDIRRRERRLRGRLGTVELAFDAGAITGGAAGDRVAVRELEIELLSGSPLAVIEVARPWVARHGLWLDTRSKAERGALLARGQAQADARKAAAVELPPDATWSQGRRAVLAACFDQVSVNASQIAQGGFGDEHVHQLRVGLRRLRTALRLFDGRSTPSPLAEAAAALFRDLGAARDQAAIGAPLQLELSRALASLGLDVPPPALPASAEPCDPVALLRAAPAQALLLDLLAQVHGAAAEPAGIDPPMRKVLARVLKRWHRQVAADAPRFAELDDMARHRLRKRAKRLRYAVEFGAALFEPGEVRRYLQPLRVLQERLGALNDAAVAIQAFQAAPRADAGVLFALGWLAGRREALLAACVPALNDLAKARRFWR